MSTSLIDLVTNDVSLAHAQHVLTESIYHIDLEKTVGVDVVVLSTQYTIPAGISTKIIISSHSQPILIQWTAHFDLKEKSELVIEWAEKEASNPMGLDASFSYSLAEDARLDIFWLWDCASDRRLVESYTLQKRAQAKVLALLIQASDAHVRYIPHVQHVGEKSSSHLMIRSLLLGNSQTILSGKLTLKPGASASAHYHNHNMILDGAPLLTAEPQLEIDFDDVECTHGVTLGRLEEDAIFYMQSRGIPPHEAKVIVLKAFFLKEKHPAVKTFSDKIESFLNRLF